MKRIRFFDIAKGIAILAVILGHSAIEANLFYAPQNGANYCVNLFFLSHATFLHSVRLLYASGT